MVCITTVLSLAAAAHGVLATPLRSRSPYAVKETHNVPEEWTKRGSAPEDHSLHLHIGLRQSQFDELERHLVEVSDPDHHRYGQHLSAEDVNELVKPSDEALELVHEWLADNGVDVAGLSSTSPQRPSTSPQRPSSSPQRPSSSVQRPTGGPQRPTNGPQRPTSGPERPTSGTQRPTSGPQRPISGPERPGTTRQGSSSTTRQGPSSTPQRPNNDNDAQRARLRQEGISRSCNASLVTPECLQYLYNADNYTAISGKSRIGFVNYLGNVPIRPDARQFLAKYRPDAVEDADNFTQTSVNGGPVQDGPLNATQLERHDSIGANQDIQAIAGMAGPIGIDSWSVGGSPSDFQPDEGTPINTNEPYVEWLNYVLRRDTLPQVIASGYYDNEQTVPESYARRVCTLFAQLGARGVTVLVPSGDFGVGINETCISNDGRSKRKFIPVFPATCPWVTAVGATHQFSPEAAAYRAPNPSVNDTAGFASGGGFSDYFRRPSYQDNAVNMYINGLGRAHENMYNKTGRGYPDVATHGANHVFVWNGTEHPISGTGQAAALHAGILGLVNDARLNGTNGTSPRPALGFLNPWLYSRGWRVYTDITRGRAVGCGTDGFPATEGWDAVTGFGTPDFRKLIGQ
ncbi:Tripeptidyl-peptidase sed3 [Lasiodiplodia hormozganensis]|uniref:tripeptidyl-peptidase II n=1 Tax=Lasiodiplodia hormozganensis TaxID=869390 RepID=A0AA39YUT7_9PEZI|nr:Tripeptidyl-peptidase sed3 [Lasiodiplodia hormozganensis]